MLTLLEIQEKMKNLSDWSIEGDSIVKDMLFTDFSQAIDFLVKVKDVANTHNHHPVIFLDYGHLRISLTTYEAKGLSDRDFSLAAAIDLIEK